MMVYVVSVSATGDEFQLQQVISECVASILFVYWRCRRYVVCLCFSSNFLVVMTIKHANSNECLCWYCDGLYVNVCYHVKNALIIGQTNSVLRLHVALAMATAMACSSLLFVFSCFWIEQKMGHVNRIN